MECRSTLKIAQKYDLFIKTRSIQHIQKMYPVCLATSGWVLKYSQHPW